VDVVLMRRDVFALQISLHHVLKLNEYGLRILNCRCTLRAEGARDNCQEWRDEGYLTSGIYGIVVPSTGVVVPTYCDMETDGKGWTLVYKHSNGPGMPGGTQLGSGEITANNLGVISVKNAKLGEAVNAKLSDADIRTLTTQRWRVTAIGESGETMADTHAKSWYFNTNCKWGSGQCRDACQDWSMSSNCKSGDNAGLSNVRVYCCGTYYSWIEVAMYDNVFLIVLDGKRYVPKNNGNYGTALIFVN
jgi:hypothetical protein